MTWPLDQHIFLSILLCAILVDKYVDGKILGSEVQIMNSAQSIAYPNLVLLSTFFLNCALPEAQRSQISKTRRIKITLSRYGGSLSAIRQVKSISCRPPRGDRARWLQEDRKKICLVLKIFFLNYRTKARL